MLNITVLSYLGAMDDQTGTTTPQLNVQPTTENVIEKRETSKNLPPKLSDPTQWNIWKVKMTLHLKSVGVWEIVTGTRIQPGDDQEEELKPYKKDQSRAQSDLLKCVGPRFEGLVALLDSPSEVWNLLTELCQQSKSTQLFKIQQQLENLHFESSVTSSLLTLKRLVKELELSGGEMIQPEGPQTSETPA